MPICLCLCLHLFICGCLYKPAFALIRTCFICLHSCSFIHACLCACLSAFALVHSRWIHLHPCLPCLSLPAVALVCPCCPHPYMQCVCAPPFRWPVFTLFCLWNSTVHPHPPCLSMPPSYIGVVDLGIEECQGSHRGYGVLALYHCLLVVACSLSCPSCLLCNTVPIGAFSLSLSLFVLCTAPTYMPCVHTPSLLLACVHP